MQLSSLPQPKLPQVSDESAANSDHSLVGWWVRITSPALNNPRRARNAWREEVASLIFLPILVNVLLPIPASLNRPIQLIILGVVFLVDIGALFLKRAGYMTTAGLILMMMTELGIATSILNLGSHFDSVNLPLYDDMIQVGLLSMAFFPPPIAFGIAFFNCCFLIVTLVVLPHAPDLSRHLAVNLFGVITTPIALEIISTFLIFTIVSALIKAIQRADKAEKLAALESQVIEQQNKDIQLKEQLDFGITEILSILNEAANGNFSVRAPLKQDNALWRIGYSINNLLARIQGFRNEKAELEKTRQAAGQLIVMLKSGQHLNLEGWTGTCLDPIIMELMRRESLPQPPAQNSPVRTVPRVKPTPFDAP